VTTSQPAADVPAWRVAVIGAVGVLAVGIGIALGSFLLGARDATIGSGASYVPASAPLYFEVRLEPSQAQDAELRELLGRFPEIDGIDLAQPLYGQLTAKLDEMLAAEGAELTWAADVEPWFDGRVGVALLALPQAALDPTLPPPDESFVPSTVALVGVTDRAAAQGSIDRIIAQSETPVTFTDQEHAGVTIRTDSESGGAYALTDDQLLIAPAADDIVAALDAHASSDTTLSEAGSITRLTDAIPDDWLLFGIYDFTDLLASALEGAAASPGTEAMRELLADQPLRGAMALTVDGDRVGLSMASDPPTGSFAVSNAERGLADEAPGDALYYAEGGNVGASLSGLIGSLKESVDTIPGAAEQLEMVESAIGGDLEDMVDWMGDAATVAGYDGEQPWGGAIIVPTSMEDARRTMDRLATFAGLAMLDPTIGVTVEERDVDGVEVTSVRWLDPNAPAPTTPDSSIPLPVTMEVVAEWAVTDDRVVIGIGDRFVERVLTLDGASSLAEVPRYRDAVAELGGPSNAGVTWVDLRGIRESVFDAVGTENAFGFDAMWGDLIPWAEPLDRVVTVARMDGDILRSDSVLLVE
jgi:hypothetical protein